MKRQFGDAFSIYGASMGRREYCHFDEEEDKSIKVFKVNIDKGGYDDGGAYWGTGAPLYCAIGNSYRRFVRAYSRQEAINTLRINPKYLKRK